MSRRWTLLGAAAIFSLLLAPPAPGQGGGGLRAKGGQGTEAKPQQLERVGVDQNLGARIPLALRFTDAAGAVHRLGDYFGEDPVLLVPSYYHCPMLCPMLINGVARSLKPVDFSPGADFQVVVFSFDPEEGPAQAGEKRREAVRRYGRPGTEQGWHFLTGEPEAIRRLTEAIGFRYSYQPERDEYAHAATVVLLTPTGEISRYFYGVEFAPRELRLGLVESSQGKIGSLIDQALLYCFRYDPATASYSAVVMNIVRLGGLLTLLVMGGFAVVLWRRRRASGGSHAAAEGST